ncbi:lytic transglycosylase domain-containing protein [Roseovarius spongiae]|nr:lytic transglycosylase domain-containing protein [Roseovarius spongiae]
MLRVFMVCLALICVLPQARAQEASARPPRPLASALDAAAAGRWDRAAQIAARDGAAAEAIIEWYRLRAGEGAPDEVQAFLAAHPDWPGLDYLRKRSEPAFEDASDAEVIALHAGGQPQTAKGVLRYARALTKIGQRGEAEATVVLAWRTMDLSTQEHLAFLEAYGPLLGEHHVARLRMTLWRGLRDSALMLPLVSQEERAVAELWRAIERGENDIEEALAALPLARRTDAGIAHARFNRFLEQNQPEKAMALMRTQSRIEGGLGEPPRWASWRRSLARRMMRAGDYAAAYDLAAHHQLAEGAAFADLEWLSGYIALRFLDEPALALDHFQRLRAGVESPISMGRAGYWIGRAQEALGDGEAAQIAYAQGAHHQTSFYGLLAAEKAGLGFDVGLDQPDPPPWRDAEFAKSTLAQAGILALASGRLNLAERLFLALADTLDETGLRQMSRMLDDLASPHLRVMLGKAAARRGIILPHAYYALHPLTQMSLPVPAEMALAIARRESEFDFSVTSGAGAQGLMQLMSGTARDVARDLGIKHEAGRVQGDWAYNARLGATYLAQLSDRFDGNVVMISAGYNAGPGRPIRWMADFGDPRAGDMDVIDWIEHIPFRETRNYVQRVAESLPIYRALLGADPLPIPFSKELIGATIPSTLDSG